MIKLYICTDFRPFVGNFNGESGEYYQNKKIKRLGELYFEYFEVGSPYGRIPLFDKVCNFVCWLIQLCLYFFSILQLYKYYF
jgi:Protein of unknown function (DUF789)